MGSPAFMSLASSGESPAKRQGHSSGPQSERKFQVHATPNKMETISPPPQKPIQDGHSQALPPSSSQWPAGHSLLCCYCQYLLYQQVYDRSLLSESSYLRNSWGVYISQKFICNTINKNKKFWKQSKCLTIELWLNNDKFEWWKKFFKNSIFKQ